MTDLKQILAINMKHFRKTLGLSQAKLAEIVDVTDNYIALIETGKRFPSVTMFTRLAKALQIDTLDLFSIKPTNASIKNNLKAVILEDIEKILACRLNETRNED